MTERKQILSWAIAVGIVASSSPAPAQQGGVLSVQPARNEIGAPSAIELMVEFSDAVDGLTVDSTSFRVFGRWSGPAVGTLSLESENRIVRFRPEDPFFAGEHVTVTLSEGIHFSSGQPLDGGYYWSFWIRSEPGDLDMEEIGRLSIRRAEEARIQSYGAYAGDLDSDGWSDLAIPNEIPADVRVFLSREGTYADFTVYDLPGSAVPSANEGGDFNGDGYIDIAVGNNGSENINLLMGTADGTLQIMPPVVSGGDSRAVCVIDLDADGDDDIITASRAQSSLHVLLNQAAGEFAGPLPLDGGGISETSCAVGDANGDGRADLFVGSFNSRQVALLLGDGHGQLLLSSTVEVPGPPWMLASGDVDGDGHADVVSAGSSSNMASVILSDGLGRLRAPIDLSSGMFPLAIDLGDIDGDGDLDMVTSNYHGGSFTVYENLGAGLFSRHRDYPASQAGSCAILHDRDNDGTLDMTGVDEIDDILIVFRTPKLGVATETPLPAQSDLRVDTHPNPTTDAVVFSLDGISPGPTEIVIYDVLGRRVSRLDVSPSHVGRSNARWDTSGYPTGVYLAVATSGRLVATSAIIVTR